MEAAVSKYWAESKSGCLIVGHDLSGSHSKPGPKLEPRVVRKAVDGADHCAEELLDLTLFLRMAIIRIPRKKTTVPLQLFWRCRPHGTTSHNPCRYRSRVDVSGFSNLSLRWVTSVLTSEKCNNLYFYCSEICTSALFAIEHSSCPQRCWVSLKFENKSFH